MREYKYLEIDGSLKLRRPVKDRVVTHGGFYSSQFGEVAYKTDIVGGGGSNFYGLNIKYPNNSIVYREMDTVLFSASNFYLTQNTPNTDEILVSLRNPDYLRRLASSNQQIVVRNTTNPVTLFSFTVPANMCKTGSVLRIYTFARNLNAASGASRQYTYLVNLNGANVFSDTSAAAALNNVPRFEINRVTVVFVSPTLCHMFVQNNRSNAMAQTVGYGSVEADSDNFSLAGEIDVACDVTNPMTFDLQIDPTTANAIWTVKHLFSYAELLP